jgi:hypothetical protein
VTVVIMSTLPPVMMVTPVMMPVVIDPNHPASPIQIIRQPRTYAEPDPER